MSIDFTQNTRLNALAQEYENIEVTDISVGYSYDNRTVTLITASFGRFKVIKWWDNTSEKFETIEEAVSEFEAVIESMSPGQ